MAQKLSAFAALAKDQGLIPSLTEQLTVFGILVTEHLRSPKTQTYTPAKHPYTPGDGGAHL